MAVLCMLAGMGAQAQQTGEGLQDNILTGTWQNRSVAKYEAAILKDGTEGLGFYPVTYTTSINANMAFAATGTMLLLDLSSLDQTDGIRVQTEKQIKSDKTLYDLQGRVVAHPTQRGIYIRNGKKFVVGRR
mgnify:FL=1